MNVDKHRTMHRSVSNLVYFWEGIKKVLFMAQLMDFGTRRNTREAGNTVTL
jgi:predicted GNAT family acetyltransferase